MMNIYTSYLGILKCGLCDWGTFKINLNVNGHMRPLSITLDCTITGHTDGLCKSEDFIWPSILNILLTKIKTLFESVSWKKVLVESSCLFWDMVVMNND